MSALWMTEAQYAAHQERVKGARVVRGSAGGEDPGPRPLPSPAKKLKPPRVPRVPRPKLSNEETLALQLAEAGVRLERQYAWLKGRKYRADFADPELRLIVELEGAAHRLKGRFRDDIRKSQDAIINGWSLLRIASDQVRLNAAVSVIKQARAALTAGRAPF
jgi:very-short-patch-repair endonuclease